MFDAFTEGVRSIIQVCHLVILAPVALTVVAARGRWQAVVGAVGGVVLGGWFFVSNRFGNITDIELRVTAASMIAGVALIAFPALFDHARPSWSTSVAGALRSDVVAFAVPAVVATMVARWWRPCVGVELGAILTDAPGDPVGQLPATIGFMLGISVPLVVIGLLYAAVDPGSDRTTTLAQAGAAGCVLLGASVIAGRHGEIVSQPFEWSS